MDSPSREISEQEDATWELLRDRIPEFEQFTPEELSLERLRATGLFPTALFYLMDQCPRSKTQFLTSDQLSEIASERRPRSGLGVIEEIRDTAGVYVISRLCPAAILKVGETSSLRRTVGEEHLRRRGGSSDSSRRDLRERCDQWPKCLFDEEIVAVLFPMARLPRAVRLFIEAALQDRLNPEMP